MKIGIINKSNHSPPEYKTTGSSGMDIMANLIKKVILHPNEIISVKTGIYLEMPSNFEAQIRPRSGLALKSGITVLNSPGTIDSDYRGEIAVILINHSKKPFEINNGDRIAQLVFSSVEKISWKHVGVLTQTERNKGGFGSTGKK